MNPDDLTPGLFGDEPSNDVTQAKDEAESKDKLYDEVDNLDLSLIHI